MVSRSGGSSQWNARSAGGSESVRARNFVLHFEREAKSVGANSLRFMFGAQGDSCQMVRDSMLHDAVYRDEFKL